MSQRNVEWVIGRLLTDEGFRRRYAEDSVATLRELLEGGVELTGCELRVLAGFDTRLVARWARDIDPRLLKADLLGAGSPVE